MGLRKSLAKKKEEESTQAQKFPLIELLAMEIEHDRESWFERAKDVIYFYQMQRKQMSGQQAIYEARALKYRKEAQRSQVKLKEFMGAYEESSDEAGQTRRRPRTMGLRKALTKQREEESDQAQQFPLTELLSMEIEHDRESWLERANMNLPN